MKALKDKTIQVDEVKEWKGHTELFDYDDVREAVLKMDWILRKYEHTRDCFAHKEFKKIFGDFEDTGN